MSRFKEQVFKYNTLAILLCGMEGKIVTVEMKNESQVKGRLETADGYMNMCLRKAKFTSATGKRLNFDLIHVKASSIRYVHLPPDVNPVTIIKQQLHAVK